VDVQVLLHRGGTSSSYNLVGDSGYLLSDLPGDNMAGVFQVGNSNVPNTGSFDTVEIAPIIDLGDGSDPVTCSVSSQLTLTACPSS